MANSTFSSTRYYEREWRDTTPVNRTFEHHRHFGASRLLDDPFFRRMPFSSSMESLRTAGLNGTSTEPKTYTSTNHQQKSEERVFADEKTRFVVVLDVSHFAPEDVHVKIADDMLVTEASHEEKQDEHGFVTRFLKRRYPLPKDIDAQNFVSDLTRDGILTVKAPKIDIHQAPKERAVPVQIISDPLKRSNMKKN